MPPLRITLTLTVSVGILVLLAVGSVLYIQWSASRQIMAELGGRAVNRSLETFTQGVQGHLDPVKHLVEYFASLIEQSKIDPSDEQTLQQVLLGSVAAAPQIGGITLIRPNLMATRVLRSAETGEVSIDALNVVGIKPFEDILSQAKERRRGYWGAPLLSPITNRAYINYRRPLWRGDEFLGFFGAAVTIVEFSTLATEISKVSGGTAFITYGNQGVLAHPWITERAKEGEATSAVVPFERVADIVLNSLNRATDTNLINISANSSTRFLELDLAGTKHFIIKRTLAGYGAVPLIIGYHLPASSVDAPLRLLYWSGLVGLAFLVVALICVVWIVRTVTRPIQRITTGVAAIGKLDLADVQPVPSSWVREVNDLANAFNGMLAGLGAFETYVPRKLVRRIMDQSNGVAIKSEERVMTVLFTDIAGFASMCEGMNATEVAEFINEHLTLLADCVEAEGGTIDKYIGDALMAFWGAPEPLDNTAIGACRAAQKMTVRIADENMIRQQAEKAPIRIRIGIHTGPLVVGNIGAPSRLNYTVVSDTVNTAQRLEGLGKELTPEAEVSILISSETQRALSSDFGAIEVGSFAVKGKSEEVRVYRLEP